MFKHTNQMEQPLPSYNQQGDTFAGEISAVSNDKQLQAFMQLLDQSNQLLSPEIVQQFGTPQFTNDTTDKSKVPADSSDQPPTKEDQALEKKAEKIAREILKKLQAGDYKAVEKMLGDAMDNGAEGGISPLFQKIIKDLEKMTATEKDPNKRIHAEYSYIGKDGKPYNGPKAPEDPSTQVQVCLYQGDKDFKDKSNPIFTGGWIPCKEQAPNSL